MLCRAYDVAACLAFLDVLGWRRRPSREEKTARCEPATHKSTFVDFAELSGETAAQRNGEMEQSHSRQARQLAR